MAGFRFRAQAALDLRVREHDAALRTLARAEAERQQAATRLEAAQRALIDGRRTADEATRTATSVADLQWYRIWIVRLERERAAMSAALAVHDTAVAAARAACLAARQRRESLERFRDNARSAFNAALAATEMKVIDELATRRFALRRQP